MSDPRTTASVCVAMLLAIGLAGAAGSGQDKPPAPVKPGPPPPTPALSVVWQRALTLPAGAPDVLKDAPHLSAGDALFFLNSEELGLTAYAQDDGHEVWTSTHVSALAAATMGKRIAVASRGVLVVLDQETGVVAWQVNLPGAPASIVAIGDRVGALIGTDLLMWAGPGEPTRTPLGAGAVTRVVIHGGVLYVGLAEPALLAADVATGAVRWRIPMPTPAQTITASDKLLYIGGGDASIYFYRTTGEAKWAKRRRLIATRGEPVVDDRSVYFTFLDNTVRAFDRNGGSERWSRELGSRPKSGPILLGGTMAIALETGAIVEVETGTGKIVQPTEPLKLAEARLQSVAANTDRSRLFTIATKSDVSRVLTAWAHVTPK